MSGIEDLSTRLDYRGGEKQVPRMNEDKLNALKKALVRSYQSATAVLADGREFKCLINPDHLKNLYDDKIISIPFEDVCLNAEKVGKKVYYRTKGDANNAKDDYTIYENMIKGVVDLKIDYIGLPTVWLSELW